MLLLERAQTAFNSRRPLELNYCLFHFRARTHTRNELINKCILMQTLRIFLAFNKPHLVK